MTEKRADPDQLLKAIQKQEAAVGRGHLKIFFGYAAGVGKTYAMLKAAQAAKARGVDVVVGYVEPHERPQTAALLTGLEILPLRTVEYNGIQLKEFDVNAALERKPKLIMLDELAHTNAPGGNNKKRYQDAQELLRAGIDVYTTINVQHIESLNDMVAAITGIVVQERIPDKVFDDADQVELVDIEPDDLIERLNEGKVYKPGQAQRALTNFFNGENLVALREIALRRCADRIKRLTESAQLKTNDYYTDEHILVCLSSSPSNPKIIRTAARMAQAFHGGFTALFVKTPSYATMSEENKKRLWDNMELAKQLKARIETTPGEEVPYQIAEFARLEGVSKVVIGRSGTKGHSLFQPKSFTDKLIEYSPNLDIYIIPDKLGTAYNAKEEKSKVPEEPFSHGDVFKSFGILIAMTLLGSVFDKMGMDDATIIIVYILGVLLTAVVTSKRIYSIASSFLSVLVFNYFFTAPRYTLNVDDSTYPAIFAVMFLAAVISGNLAMKIKNQAKEAAQNTHRMKLMLDTMQALQKAQNKQEIISATAKQIIKLLDKDIIVYLPKDGQLAEPQIFSQAGSTVDEGYYSENEKAVAAWTFKNNKSAGTTTDTLASAKCLYFALRSVRQVYGVIGIVMEEGEPLTISENSILLGILRECGQALENRQTLWEREQAMLVAQEVLNREK